MFPVGEMSKGKKGKASADLVGSKDDTLVSETLSDVSRLPLGPYL